jgi:hypothetical protein
VYHHPPELSRSVVPPGGFHYEQGLGDGSYTRIEGGSLDQLLDRILVYRQQNGMILASGTEPLPESVWRDYNAQVCGQYPWLCTGVREAPVATVEGAGVASGFELLVLRMSRWVDGLKRGPIDWVDQKNATDRANICLGCPQNVDWHSSCGTCNQNLVLGAAAVRGVRRTGVDAGLKGCRAFGTLQELAVWISEPGGDAKYKAPAICWRLKEGL